MNPDVQRLIDARETLGEEDPSNAAVRLADVLDEIAGLIQRFIALPHADLAMLIACWIANTYLFNSFSYCGYLALRSATPRCGKSRLLRLVALLAFGTPPITMNPTAATLFRVTRRVLILDEVDRLKNQDKEKFGDVLAVLNAGFERGGVVERMEKTKGSWEPKSFPVYGPKALAGIEALADTLSDRAFVIRLQRTGDRMPRLNVRRLEGQAVRIRQDLERWSARHTEDIQGMYEALPDTLPQLAAYDDRFQDIAEPLCVLASFADSERSAEPSILERLLKGLEVVAGRREPSGRERELLAFLDFAESRLAGHKEAFVKTGDLLAACAEREDLSRIESARALAGFLRHFDLLPGFNSAKTERGYTITRGWLTDLRARYGWRGRPEEEGGRGMR
jgi:Fe-S-cluster formation regulator IscX/YfhJ